MHIPKSTSQMGLRFFLVIIAASIVMNKLAAASKKAKNPNTEKASLLQPEPPNCLEFLEKMLLGNVL